MTLAASKTLLLKKLCDETDKTKVITKTDAEQLFNFFKQCRLFRWYEANNDCEDRANAICLLLDEWKIPNYKGWVLSAFFLGKGTGSLLNGWNFHVAALLPVPEENSITWYIIDPVTADKLITLENWALKLTDKAYSYHFIKSGEYYIFPSKKIEQHPWHKRDKRNYRWTIQGLGGINGLSSRGKAVLTFNKKKVKNTAQRFKALKSQNPLMTHE